MPSSQAQTAGRSSPLHSTRRPGPCKHQPRARPWEKPQSRAPSCWSPADDSPRPRGSNCPPPRTPLHRPRWGSVSQGQTLRGAEQAIIGAESERQIGPEPGAPGARRNHPGLQPAAEAPGLLSALPSGRQCTRIQGGWVFPLDMLDSRGETVEPGAYGQLQAQMCPPH